MSSDVLNFYLFFRAFFSLKFFQGGGEWRVCAALNIYKQAPEYTGACERDADAEQRQAHISTKC